MTDRRSRAIRLIHVAARDLALTEETYRALLKRVTGHESCARMSQRQLEDVLAEFRRLGWRRRTPPRRGQPTVDSRPLARKALALWITLAQLGALRDPSDRALDRFCSRVTGVDAIRWARPHELNAVIEALKDWVERERSRRAAR